MPSKLTTLVELAGFALGKATKGGKKELNALLSMIRKDLSDSGIPEEAIARIEKLGKGVLKGPGLPKSVEALAGSRNNAHRIEEVLGVARSAWHGVSGTDLKTQWNTLLQSLEKEGVSARVIEGLKSLDPAEVARIGVAQPLSAFERLGPDPFISRMYRKVLGKAPGTTKGQASILTEVLGEAKEDVAAGTTKMLTAGGVPGFSKTAQVGRSVAGAVGGYSGAGAAVNVGLPAFFGARGLMNNDAATAKTQAVEGFMALGGTSSSAVLSEIVKQQEQAARRQMVLQTHDPELFSRVLGVLGDAGASPSALTKTERQIGRQTEVAMPARRTDEDVKFLLDQLLQESSGGM